MRSSDQSFSSRASLLLPPLSLFLSPSMIDTIEGGRRERAGGNRGSVRADEAAAESVLDRPAGKAPREMRADAPAAASTRCERHRDGSLLARFEIRWNRRFQRGGTGSTCDIGRIKGAEGTRARRNCFPVWFPLFTLVFPDAFPNAGVTLRDAPPMTVARPDARFPSFILGRRGEGRRLPPGHD